MRTTSAGGDRDSDDGTSALAVRDVVRRNAPAGRTGPASPPDPQETR